MVTTDTLISVCGNITLEYLPNENSITVIKKGEGKPLSVTVFPDVKGEKLRILCGMLWAARATPLTVTELAEEIEV